ncbi:MAG: TetR/AcrR family transcriptional regulator [Anaerolineales bacterium]
MTNHTDRRVRRTRKALQDALLSLILEKGYDSLTVEELAERADVGRTTFYLHYQDKDELLLDLTGDFAQAMQAEFLARLDENEVCVRDLVALLFELAHANVEVYYAIMSGRCGAPVLEQFQGILTALFRQLLEVQAERRGVALPLPTAFVAHYLFGALRESLIWWLDRRRPYTPAEMVTMFQRLTLPALSPLFEGD